MFQSGPGMFALVDVCLLLLTAVLTGYAQDCMMSPPVCMNGASCTDLPGPNNFMCTCATGYSGDRCEVDACDNPNPCQNGGTCMRMPMGNMYECECPDGFSGNNCEVDACSDPNPCQNGGTCMHKSLGNMYDCACPDGFSGNNCEDDACDPNPCDNDGTCTYRSSGNMYDCECPAGFTGNTCGRDECDPSPCQNGGTCVRQSTGNMYDCNCPEAFAGTNCENENRCIPNPCMNGGMCEPRSSGNMYDCSCNSGFSGTDCEKDACSPNPCQNGGMCVRQSSGNMFDCMCTGGFTGGVCENGQAAATNTVVIAVSVVVVIALLVAIIIVLVCFFRRSRRLRSRGKPGNAETGRARDQELTQKHTRTDDYHTNPRKPSEAARGRSREFPRDKLHLFGQIGSGSFAVVYKAEADAIVRRGVNTTVAVKMLKESATPTDQSDFKKELNMYSMLDPHPNVLSMLGCCTDKDPMYIILEYVPHGNLQSYLRHIRTGTEPIYQNKAEFKKDNLTPTEILTFASQVVRGMEYLASKMCIHRDLATRNILLGEGLMCKVADFGLARDVAEQSQYEMQSQGRVPVRWMAPESLISNMYTSKSDVWSFGVLLWELVTLGSHPYPGMSSQKVISELKKGYRLPKPDHCSDDIYKVMTDCWQERPEDRPDFGKLHVELDNLLADATGYLEMADLNQDDYMYLEPGQDTSNESS